MSIGCDLQPLGNGFAIMAPAKINLHLGVGGRRDDEYHEIDTVMVTVGLCDRLIVQPAPTVRLRTAGDQVVPADPSNLCFRAARELLSVLGRREEAVGACITLDKQIPVGAGLGGGSADAAATLIALNRLWQLELSMAELESIGSRLGSDVPFCVRGGVARGTGRGEIISPLAPDLPLWFIVSVPDESIHTKTAYDWLDDSRATDIAARRPDLLLTALQSGLEQVPSLLHNDFQAVVSSKVAGVRGLLTAFASVGMPAVVSGSGSAVVGVTEDARQADAALPTIARHARGVWAVPTARARADGSARQE